MKHDKAERLLKNPDFQDWYNEQKEAAEKRLFNADRESAADELMALNVIKSAYRSLETSSNTSLRLAEANRKQSVI